MLATKNHGKNDSDSHSVCMGTNGEPTKKEETLIIKTGIMRKMKTMKKKFFVLKEETKNVFLDYFDSEKKYRDHPLKPKRTINITECFSINRRPLPSKSKQFAISIFTWDAHVSLILDQEDDMKQWLDALSNACGHGYHYKGKEDNVIYDHVWQVLIVKKDLGFKENISGIHRLCLTSKILHVYRVDSSTVEVDHPLEFQLNSIRKCGHTDNFFSVFLGRSSPIGAGELLMQADDNVTAQVMHETIREAMKSEASSSTTGTSRPRSSSSSDGSKNRRSTLGSLHPPHVTPPSTTSPLAASMASSSPSAVTPTSLNPIATSSSIRSRCDSLPSRSRCITEGTSGNTIYSGVTTTSQSKHRFTSSSPPIGNQPLSSTSGACSTESVGSSCLSDEYTEGDRPLPVFSRETSAIPSQPSIREEETDDYCPMDLSALKVSTNSESTASPNHVVQNQSLSSLTNSLTSPINEEYMPMNNPTSLPDSQESGYLSMLPTTSSTRIDLGYLNMAPPTSKSSSSRGKRSSSSGHSSHHGRVQSPPPAKECLEKLSSEFPLAPVKSFFSPAEEPADLIKPVRAYSMGSRPTKTLFLRTPNLLPTSVEDPTKQDEQRLRAQSMGCHGTAGLREKLKDRVKPSIEQVLGTIDQLEGKTKKSSSTPALTNKSHRLRSSTVGCRPTASQIASCSKGPLRDHGDHMLLDYTAALKGDDKKFRTRTNTRSSSASNPESTRTPSTLKQTSSKNVKTSQDLDYAEIDFNQDSS